MFKSLTSAEKVDYILVFLIIAVSGLNFFTIPNPTIFLLFGLTLFVFLKRSIAFNLDYLIVCLFYFIIEMLQFLLIDPYPISLVFGTQIRLFIGIFIISVVGKKFIPYYVNIIYFFAIVSFIFFIPSIISSGFYNFFVNSICPIFEPRYGDPDPFYKSPATIIIFCFHEVIPTEFRNPGPFWEPGAFAIYLNLALIFNLIIEKKIWTKKNIILSIALITTFSTSGYIAFFILIFSFYTINQSIVKKIMYGLFLLPILITLYFSLDFLNKKVEQNISLAGTTTSSRFGSAEADFKDLAKSPFIGWGRGEMRYGGKQFTFFSSDQHRNNGVTDLFATYGIFLATFCFYYYYKAFKSICSYYQFNLSFAFAAIIIFLLLGFSQGIFQYPFFKSLLFLSTMYNQKSVKKLINYS